MESRLRSTRLSPIPIDSSGGGNAVFPTVLEDPDQDANADSSKGYHVFRKHRRRLPLVQNNISKNSRSSRSFDSGISCLLQSSTDNGSPGPDSAGSPSRSSHISTSQQKQRQSYNSPCNSPGPVPRSPRILRGPLSPRLSQLANSASNCFFGNNSASRRFSEQISSNPVMDPDSDSSPPTTEPSPPPASSSGSSGSKPTSPILRVSRRMLPETPKSPYNVWQQSRDSLDSGVYSRSTTCDSSSYNSNTRKGSPTLLSSTSPPTLARHSWRRSGGVARLPEPPVSSSQSTAEIPVSSNEDQKRVHFDEPSKSSMGILASLKNTYNASKLEQSSPVKSSAGILSKLHEKLTATGSTAGRSSPLSNLDVPKLRDLKSHSFPPPFNNCNNPSPSAASSTDQLVVKEETTDLLVNSSPSTDSSFNDDFEVVEETLEERRKRWFLQQASHNSSYLESG